MATRWRNCGSVALIREPSMVQVKNRQNWSNKIWLRNKSRQCVQNVETLQNLWRPNDEVTIWSSQYATRVEHRWKWSNDICSRNWLRRRIWNVKIFENINFLKFYGYTKMKSQFSRSDTWPERDNNNKH